MTGRRVAWPGLSSSPALTRRTPTKRTTLRLRGGRRSPLVAYAPSLSWAPPTKARGCSPDWRTTPRPSAIPTFWSVPPATWAMRCCPGRRGPYPRLGPGRPALVPQQWTCLGPARPRIARPWPPGHRPGRLLGGNSSPAGRSSAPQSARPAATGLGREQEAEDLFRQTLDRDPSDTVVANELARLLARTSHGDEAEDLFRQTLDRNPSNTVAANELAQLLVHTGREDEAEKLLGRVFEDLPHHNPVVLYSLALVRTAGGRPERRHCSRNPKWGPSDFGCEK